MSTLRTPVSTAVYDALRAKILSGALAAGAPIPSERELAETFAVNRHAVREAVKRLQQAGLVAVHHGGATRVTDWAQRGGLDLLAGLALHRGGEDLVLSAFEMRRTIGVDAARLCARRADDTELDDIADMSARVRGDLDSREGTYRAMWRWILLASDNIAYRLAFNSLIAAVDADLTAALAVLEAELLDDAARDALVSALRARDAEAAATAADALLSLSVKEAAPWSR